MSTLSIVATAGVVEVLAKTEPAAPPRPLSSLLGVELARTIQDGQGPVEIGAAMTRWMLGGLSDEGRRSLVQACADLVVATNAHPDCGVVLLGQVELVAFASPAGADPRDLEEFLRVMNLPGTEVKVVDEQVARAAAVLPMFTTDSRMLVCDWGDDLVVRVLHAHDTLYHVSSVGSAHRSARLGEAELERRMAAAPEEGGQRQALREEVFGRLVLKGRNFLARTLPTVDTTAATCALVSGDFARHGSAHEAVVRALSDTNLAVVPRGASVGEGLHRLFLPSPKLPYDCGILLAPQGSRGSLGTLVLVRPTAVGQSRTSEEFELLLQGGKSLEVGIYMRRLKLGDGATTIQSERFDSLVFAPEVKEGVARLEVTMRVDNDDERPGEVLVSMVVRDLNSKKELRFDRVRLLGAAPLNRPLVRDAQVLPVLHWLSDIEPAIEDKNNAGKSFPVRAWREYLERPKKSGEFTRARYAKDVLAAVGIHIATELSNPTFVDKADPEQFQAAARAAILAGMHAFAARHHTGGRWAAKFDKPVRNVELATEFLNEQSQALASHSARTELMKSVQELVSYYETTCVLGQNLNVKWN